MSVAAALDLTLLPLPDVVEPLDAEVILADRIADLGARLPDLVPVLALESEPLVKAAEADTYREVLLRARINDAARAGFIATATGTDLDHLVAIYGVVRLLVTPANPAAIPPTPAVYETDAELRRRALLALEALTNAGPRGAWLYHALTADADVLDAGVYGPDDAGAGVPLGSVRVAVLSRTGDGTAAPGLLATVAAALNDDEVRPLGVIPIVETATIVPYAVTASLRFLPGPGTGPAMASIEAALQAYVAETHRVGAPVYRSALFAVLHRLGVVAEVTLTSPAADVLPAPGEAPWCSAITLTEEAP